MGNNVVIIGAGQAGGRTAEHLRAQGYDGTIHLIGEEPHAPYERPPLSKDFLTDGTAAAALTIIAPQTWDRLGIAFLPATAATAIDRAARIVRLSDGSRLQYDALVMATGARPRTLPLPVPADCPVHYLRTIADAEALRVRLRPGRHLCVIGAGVIGLEIAASARALGLDVTVIERDAEPLGRIVPPAIGAWFWRFHEDAGIHVLCGVMPTDVSGDGDGVRIDLSDGSWIEADLVAVGIGVVPNVELLAGQGIDISDGILVDASCRSADPNILAVGDVARPFRPLLGRAVRLEAWRNAERQPAVAAATLLGQRQIYDEVPWMWSDQHGLNLQVAGRPHDGDQTVVRGDPSSDRFAVGYLRDGVLVGAITVNQGRDMRSLQTLIAARATIEPESFANRGTSLAGMRPPANGRSG